LHKKALKRLVAGDLTPSKAIRQAGKGKRNKRVVLSRRTECGKCISDFV